MPMHDWTRVDAGSWHEFHQSWSVRIKDALNGGVLPKGFYAFVEAKAAGFEPDVVAIQVPGPDRTTGGGTATLTVPQTKIVTRIESARQSYARRANRISVRHAHGDVVAVIELVSPGNKDTQRSVKAFVDKAVELLKHGVHFVLIDLFPPTTRDPHGMHQAVLDELAADAPYDAPPGKDRVLVGYCAEREMVAYIEPVGVGDVLAPVPLYLATDLYVSVPLEATYAATWTVTPEPIRELLEPAA